MILSASVCVWMRGTELDCVLIIAPHVMKCSILSCFPPSDLPKAALRILSNMTFLFVSLSYTAECAIVTAFITFIPKFIESQFGIPASNASIYTGKCFCGQCLLIHFFFLYSFILSQYIDISLCCLVSHYPVWAAIEDVWEPVFFTICSEQ